MNKLKYSYVTLLSSQEYILPVLVLNQSLLNVKSQYPLLVLITDDVAKDNYILNVLK